jgi:hypothetical protein
LAFPWPTALDPCSFQTPSKEVTMSLHMRLPGSIAATCILLHAAATGLVVAQESTTFSVDRTTVTSAGQSVASPSFATTVIAGQVSPSGAASFCNAGYTASFGFFSIFGDLSVPIVLQVNGNEVDPSNVELEWTGTASAFRVYRSLTPHDVLDPSHLSQQTSLCNGSDSVGSDPIVFYMVTAEPGR